MNEPISGPPYSLAYHLINGVNAIFTFSIYNCILWCYLPYFIIFRKYSLLW